MRKSFWNGIALGLFLLGSTGLVKASDVDELRQRAKQLQKEASILAERGKTEEAQRLKRESVELLETAERMELKAQRKKEGGERPDFDNKVRRIKERLADLLNHEKKLREARGPENELAEVREQIAKMERELKNLLTHHAGPTEMSPEFRSRAEKLAQVSRRIEHLRIAAQNLKMAEVHDLALELMKKAEGMERDLHEAKKQLAAEMEKARGTAPGPDFVRELQSEMDRLRQEVKELRQRLEKR